MFNREKWDLRFLEMAKLVSTWSKDPSTGIGAVITNDKNRIISLGFNGYPRGIKDEGMENREEKLAKVLHAEVNAILFANRILTDHTIYVYPLLPCSNCMSIIIQSGITRIVIMQSEQQKEIVKRWKKSTDISLSMAKEAGIPIAYYYES
jgi:dCMP deaminase